MKQPYSGNITADLLDADYEDYADYEDWLDEEEEWQARRERNAAMNEEEKIERAIDRRHQD